LFLALWLAASIAHLPSPLRGDFDHDGRKDVASLVPARHGQFQLIISRGATGRPTSVIRTFKREELANLYLDTAKAGRWKTWCGKGGGDERDPCPQASVLLKGGELTFGTAEASESVVIWNRGRFEVILLSD